MKKLNLTLALMWCLGSTAQISFQKTFVFGIDPNNKSSIFKSITELSDGSFLVGGEYGNGRVFATKVSSSGDTIWTKNYQYAGFVDARMVKIFKGKDNLHTICATVMRQAAGSWMYLFKLNDNGDTVSTQRFSINGSVKDIVQLDDSGFVFTTNNQSTNGRIYRVSKNMEQVWSYMPFPGQMDSVPLNTLFNGIKLRNGALFISARMSLNGASETYLGKWNLDGSNIFFRKYALGKGLSVVDMEMTEQNNCLLVGSQSVATIPGLFTDAYAIMRTNENGDSIDMQYWDGPITDNANSISEGNSQFIVTGMGSSANYGQTVTVLGLDHVGKIKWNTNLYITNSLDSNSRPTHEGQYSIETTDGFIVTVGSRNSNVMAGPRESFIAKFKPQQTTGITSISKKSSLSELYPNPIKPGGYLYITNHVNEAQSNKATLKLINLAGEVVYEVEVFNDKTLRMEVPYLATGIYGLFINGLFQGKVQLIHN